MLPLASALATALTSSSSPPHICYILADDLGWNDIGYHNSRIQSPHIDALAHGGLMLDQFYVQLVCSPSRAAIMTGKYPFRLGLSHGFIAAGAPYGLPLDEITVAQELHDANYATAIVGKVSTERNGTARLLARPRDLARSVPQCSASRSLALVLSHAAARPRVQRLSPSTDCRSRRSRYRLSLPPPLPPFAQFPVASRDGVVAPHTNLSRL